MIADLVVCSLFGYVIWVVWKNRYIQHYVEGLFFPGKSVSEQHLWQATISKHYRIVRIEFDNEENAEECYQILVQHAWDKKGKKV